MISYEEANRIWRYDQETGKFFWKIAPRLGNAVPIGAQAGCITGDGYLQLWYNQKRQLGHQVAWLMMTGTWPTKQIDHINGNKGDNRFFNLREATRSQNQHNRGATKKNKLGIKGVTARIGRKGQVFYTANICVDKKRMHLGCFVSANAAKSAYDVAAMRYHGKFARTNG